MADRLHEIGTEILRIVRDYMTQRDGMVAARRAGLDGNDMAFIRMVNGKSVLLMDIMPPMNEKEAEAFSELVYTYMSSLRRQAVNESPLFVNANAKDHGVVQVNQTRPDPMPGASR